ncbi:magnesium transporter [Marchantia polymorpha subsp. ruderalis]|uniref:Magnesium transporter n=2 Tax=Marchantia polymorpha TaxID=3197 RepID=A0A176WQ46_MARPO|nr:hypothetical protein AXG93_2528s1060 [Marchantia polymorpha subsp. ruderalis]PTQ30874.1 hypothetical protein MARPO_0118s0011 [Marchantia polymorpha]BBN04882.1 hypothetical protein Mp_3g08530 [Marchantia polymorpha subsp. ruderalis]|eukprot:PTQ30874.1 hypothetical protein MARPO_0118s0011 [Marchantia polymorpha]
MRPRTPPVKSSVTGTGAVDEERDKEKEKATLLGLRKKGMGVRAWLMIDAGGKAQLVEAGKHAIMRRACLPARDLRILDPLLTYPSTILGRERAIVVNLEHIKAIITAQEVLLLNSKDPAVVPIVLDLQRRLPLHFNSFGQQVAGDGGGGLSDNEGDGHVKPPANSPADGMSRVSSSSKLNKSGQGPQTQGTSSDLPPSPPQSRANDFRNAGGSPPRANGGPSVLPFEFRALEVCLEAACTCLDSETVTLEREAYPALDELTSKLSTLNLERVRQIKSRLVAISGRVQKVRDEIEQLLDDDGDMAEMYLTDKLLRNMEGALSPTSSDGGARSMSFSHMDMGKMDSSADLDKASNAVQPDIQDSEANEKSVSKAYIGMEDMLHSEEVVAKRAIVRSRSSSSSSSSSTSHGGKLDVEELEMLLEAYFVQIDGTLNKLSTLREYVDDTEDYINIMLDDKQNHLLQMGVLLTTATLVVSAFIVVTGIFGMNIHIDLFEADNDHSREFLFVVVGSFIGCVTLYTVAIAWCKYKRLIE